MSLTANKKKEIINNLGKYRKNSDDTVNLFIDFTKQLTRGLAELTSNLNSENKIEPKELANLMIKLQPAFYKALDTTNTYYDSLSKDYVTALNEIANIKTDKDND